MGQYKKNRLTLTGAVSMGTGVMIGAGIFALLGQVAELSGSLFPVAFVVGAVISAFSAYSYNAFPSAGDIGMYLKKEYGKTTFTAFAALCYRIFASAKIFKKHQINNLGLFQINKVYQF